MKTLIALSTLLAVSACAPSFPPGPAGNLPVYDFIGCHNVIQETGPNGEVAFGPFGFNSRYEGAQIYFKQRSTDGSLGPITTAVPCE